MPLQRDGEWIKGVNYWPPKGRRRQRAEAVTWALVTAALLVAISARWFRALEGRR